MTLLQRQMTAAVRFEARYLGVSRRSGFLTQQAQKTFLTYARAECLAEANPYRGGTIYPIIFGECSLSLYRQRLALIVEQTQYLQRGGPAAPSS